MLTEEKLLARFQINEEYSRKLTAANEVGRSVESYWHCAGILSHLEQEKTATEHIYAIDFDFIDSILIGFNTTGSSQRKLVCKFSV